MSALSKWLAGALVLLYLGVVGASAATGKAIQGYSHTQWTAEDGAPTGIVSLAQTRDGWLWAATLDNLYRFDGLRFERYKLVQRSDFDQDRITFIRAVPNGDLYIGYASAGVSILHPDGKTERLPLPPLHTALRALIVDTDGSTWVIDNGIQRLQKGQWEVAGLADVDWDTSASVSMLLDQQGQVWAASASGAWRLDRSSRTFQKVSHINGELLLAPDGSVWQVAKSGAILQLSTPARTGAKVETDFQSNQQGRKNGLFVKEGVLWLANCPELICSVPPAVQQKPGAIRPAPMPGLPARVRSLDRRAYALLQDQEGNIWFATEAGLHRLRQNTLTNIGLSGPGGNYSLATDGKGNTWAADRTNPGLWELRPDTAPKLAQHGLVTMVANGRQGSILAGGTRMIKRMGHPSEFIELPPIPGSASQEHHLASIIDDGKILWINSIETGIAGWVNGKWVGRAALRLPSAIVKSGVGGPGQLWMATSDRSLVLYDNDKLSRYDIDELGATTILSANDDFFLGGANGAGVFKAGKLARLSAANPEILRDVSGLVITIDGDHWLNSSAGLVHIRATDWRQSVANPVRPLRYTLFGSMDGYPGRSVTTTRLPTMVSPDGRNLWMLGTDGVAWLNTGALRKLRIVPRPIILNITVDNVQYAPDAVVRLPPGTTHFRLSYTVPLLRAPEAARFELRLDSVDAHWQDAGSRRATTYTNLRNGTYTFQLRAFNEGDVASEVVTMKVVVEPTLIQTDWFKILCSLMFILGCYFFYRYLKHHRAKMLIEHLGSRVVERDRTSNELNDTVIQSMQGVLLLTESAADKFTGEQDPTLKAQLSKAFKHANTVLTKGRDRVETLREGSNDELVDMFDILAEDETGVSVIVRQSGVSRDVHTAVKEELFAVGREALRSAVRDRNATQISVQLIYRNRELLVEVSDDGTAMPTNTSPSDRRVAQKTLNALCQRAEQIGAKCFIESRPGENLVRISIPAKLAYQRSRES